MTRTVVLLNRDLRVHDNPALATAAARSDQVLPLFVFDRALLNGQIARPNRLAFLLESLADLDGALTKRGARLFVRHGDPVRESVELAKQARADAIFASADVSGYAQSRQTKLARACERERIGLRLFDGTTIVAPGTITPTGGGDHFKVFTPYWLRWQVESLRDQAATPRKLRSPSKPAKGELPALTDLTRAQPSPDRVQGGESRARRAMSRWLNGDLASYDSIHDDLSTRTSQLSAYLRFGCLSPLELAQRSREHPGAEGFIRQLCWRDFFAQVTAAEPSVSRRDYRPRGDRWRRDRYAIEAWRAGATGFPIVDAAMRQLEEEGYMHNRARLIVGSFLTKDLYVDWRVGAAHFWNLLSDGDIPNNSCNWQWIAGTGNDSRPNRVLNPITQAKRYDPNGEYVRRYLPELEPVSGKQVHEPWKLDTNRRRQLDYPDPIVDHGEAARAFKARRG